MNNPGAPFGIELMAERERKGQMLSTDIAHIRRRIERI